MGDCEKVAREYHYWVMQRSNELGHPIRMASDFQIIPLRPWGYNCFAWIKSVGWKELVRDKRSLWPLLILGQLK